jgi:putative ATP-binding cassette transporter
MELFRFLRRETPVTWRAIITLALLAGLANAVIITVVNLGASEVAETGDAGLRLLVLFATSMAIFVIAKKAALGRGTVLMEGMLTGLRTRIVDKIRRAELSYIERLGRGELFTKLSQDMSLISQSAFLLLNAAQDILIVVFCLGYLLYLSPPAWLITVVSVVIGTGLYFRHRRQLMLDLDALAKSEAKLVDSLGHILDGFKEIRLNAKKSDAVYQSFQATAEGSRSVRVRLHQRYVVDLMFSSVFFYLLLAAVVFLMPRFVPTYGSVVIQIVAVLLFVVGPLQTVAGAAPMLSQTNAALRNLYELETQLDANLTEPATSEPLNLGPSGKLTTISHLGVSYDYVDESGQPLFRLGPLDLELQCGKIHLICGGNGAGKSTLLKLITGLYTRSSGTIRVNSTELGPRQMSSYRELLSAIFTDFHLFDALYGLEGIEPRVVMGWLEKMKVEHKTEFENGRFTHSNLSTGQRKRLAMIVALLEKRELLVFDEWAADQDQEYRGYFYETLLPALKEEGKTIVAVTHDDRYFHIADHLLKLDAGKLSEIPVPEAPPASLAEAQH